MEPVSDILERVIAAVTAETGPELLRRFACPSCGVAGGYEAFHEPNNNGVGLSCRACGRKHPFRSQGLMWLRKGAPKRSNDIRTVMATRGEYCWLCGTTYQVLRHHGIGMHVHHTRPFAVEGDDVEKIPLCALCHEVASAIQRHYRHLFDGKGAA